MPNDLIRYDLLVQEALCGVVSKVLSDVARQGLPGDHHFYITFRTHAPGVRLSSMMRELYPDEMTIILQHQFEDLRVTDHGFEVGLSFKGVPEILLIPFDALTGFFDPSVQFSLKFEPHGEGDEDAVVADPRDGNPAKLELARLESIRPQVVGKPQVAGKPQVVAKPPVVAKPQGVPALASVPRTGRSGLPTILPAAASDDKAPADAAPAADAPPTVAPPADSAGVEAKGVDAKVVEAKVVSIDAFRKKP